MTYEVKDHFTTQDLVRYAGLSMHMVNYLCRYEILDPWFSTDRRRGLRRRFSFSDLLLAKAVSQLLQSGVSVMALRKSLFTLRTKIDALPAGVFTSRRVAIVGNSVYLFEPGEQLIDLTSNGQLAFHFVLEAGNIPVRRRCHVHCERTRSTHRAVAGRRSL